jgi:hypothetical protein
MKIEQNFFHFPNQSLRLIIAMTLLLNIVPLVAFAEMDSAQFGIYKFMFSLHGMKSPSAQYCGLTNLDNQTFKAIQKMSLHEGASPSQMKLLKNAYHNAIQDAGLFLVEQMKSKYKNCPIEAKNDLRSSFESNLKASEVILKKP